MRFDTLHEVSCKTKQNSKLTESHVSLKISFAHISKRKKNTYRK